MKYFVFLWVLLGLAACHSSNNPPATSAASNTTAAPVAVQPKTVENDSQRIDYFANGKEKTNTQLKDGKMNGQYHGYYESGKNKETGLMADDQKTGIWRFYDTLGRLQQVGMFAKGSMVTEMDTADYNLTNRKFAAEKMQATVPNDWQVVDVGVNPTVIMVCEKKCNEDDKFCPNFTFTKEPLGGKGTFDDYINYGNEILKHSIPNFKMITQGKATINGYKAYRVEYRGNAENIKLGSIMTLYYSRDTVYIMNCMAKDQPKGEFARYQNLFTEISNSLKPL